MIIRDARSYTYSLQLKAPLRRKEEVVVRRKGVLFFLQGEEDFIGWGEAAPLPGFSRITLQEAQALGRAAAKAVTGRSIADARNWLTPEQSGDPSVYFAFHQAFRVLAQEHEEEKKDSCTVALCSLLDGDLNETEARLQAGLAEGCRCFKLKVARRSLAEETDLVAHILSQLPSDSTLRLDANRGWTYDEALAFCCSVPLEKIAFIEEPLQDWRQIPRLQTESGIACAVDECLQDMSALLLFRADHDREALMHAYRTVVEAACYLVWKPSLSFPPEALGLDIRKRCILSGAYESGVGTAAVLEEALRRGGASLAAGVDTYSRLAEDLLLTPLHLEGNRADARLFIPAGQAVDVTHLEECCRE